MHAVAFSTRHAIIVRMLDDEERHKDIDPSPGPSATDWFAGIVTAGIAGLPAWWAAPAAALFAMITAPILGRAREDWLEEVRVELNDLYRRLDQLTPEALSKSEVFVAAIAQATQAALRTHEAEKREALKNAVVHIGSTPLLERALARWRVARFAAISKSCF